jgi:Polyketide cyclase / dehydrase and lipid transport
MHPCQRVGLDFIDSAPFRFVSTVDLTITPEQVFEALDDAQSWPLWATVITKVTWSSPQPHGVGTTRTVDMRGGIVGDEEFLAWEPHSHMAFRFNQASCRRQRHFPPKWHSSRQSSREGLLECHFGEAHCKAAQALRRSASGSSTTMSWAVMMMRVKRFSVS